MCSGSSAAGGYRNGRLGLARGQWHIAPIAALLLMACTSPQAVEPEDAGAALDVPLDAASSEVTGAETVAADAADAIDTADSVDAAGDVSAPSFDAICAPCGSDADCLSGALKCLFDASSGMSHCTMPCSEAADCPAGYTCAGGQCRPQSGDCWCTSWALAHGSTGSCQKSNAFGTCHGVGSCPPDGGMPACSASEPQAEVCNGKDDDCDGVTDGASACPAKLCQIATCDGSAGKCSYKWACDDANPCTLDQCAADGCAHAQIACEPDYNPCTAEVCDPAQGCVHLAKDGSPCDADQNACTAGDHCNASGGCVPGPAIGTCSDGDLCTSGDYCQGSVCFAGAMAVCDDGVACTFDWCSASLGCRHTVSGACDDGNSCTLDGCNSTGCTHAPSVGSCAMATPCLGLGVCTGTTCSGAKPASCDDSNPCTSDTCDYATGCQHGAIPNGSACADSCGVASQCTQGRCIEVSGLGLHVYQGGGTPDCGGGPVAAWSGGYVMAGYSCYLRAGKDGELTGWQVDGALKDHGIYAIAADESGVALAGVATATASLVKFGPADQLQWEALAVDATDSAWNAVVRDADGWFAAGWQGGSPFPWQGKSTSSGLAAQFDNAGKPLWTMSYPDFAVLAAVARPGGFVLAGVDAKQTVSVRAVDSGGKTVWQIPNAGSCDLGNNQQPGLCLRLLTVSDGFVLVTPGGIGLLLVHISATGKVLATTEPDGPFVTDFAWAPAGSGLLFAGTYGWKAWDAAGVSHAPWPPLPAWFNVAATASTGSRIALGGSAGSGGSLYILDAWGNASCAASGVCLAMPATACDDAIAGTMDRCDAKHGGCWHDGPASLADCPTEPCQIATFSATAGCGNQAIAAGVPCIATCGAPGTCNKWGACDTAPAADGNCDDGNACTEDACTATGCVHQAISCATSICDPGVCDQASGQCQPAPLPDGTSCGDNGCGNVCVGGACAVEHRLGNVKPMYDSPTSLVIVTPSGLVGVGQYGGQLARWDFAGKEVWPASWNGPWANIYNPLALVQTPKDFAVLANDATPTIARLDPAGVLKSQVALTLDETNIPVAMAADPSGVRIASSIGKKIVPGVGWYAGKPWLGVVDEGGAVVWQKTLNLEFAIQGAQKLASGFAFVGLSLELTPVVVVADDAGGLLWQAKFGDAQTASDNQLMFAAAADGGLFVEWTQADQSHVVLTKFDAKGAVTWQRVLADAGMRQLTGLPDGGVAILGPGAQRLNPWGNDVVQGAAGLNLYNCLVTPLGLACQGNPSSFTFTDPWLNASCADSGPCLSKSWADCSDGDPCTADRCDAQHGGCWHPAFDDGSLCGMGKTCKAGSCQ